MKIPQMQHSADQFELLPGKLQSEIMWRCLRKWFPLGSMCRVHCGPSRDQGYHRTKLALLWRQHKATVIDSFLVECPQLPPFLSEYLIRFTNRKIAARRAIVVGKTLLLTYISQEWTLPHELLQSPPKHDTTDVNRAVQQCRDSEFASSIWADFCIFASELAKTLRCTDRSLCSEVCTETLKNTGRVRFHMHLWLRSDYRINLKSKETLEFAGHHANAARVMGGIIRDNCRASFQGALYTSDVKLGSVFYFSTRVMFKDFLIQPSWVMNLLQQGKISLETARTCVTRSCQNVGRYLKDISTIIEARETEAISEECDRVRAALSPAIRAFRIIPAVQEWQNQFESDSFRFSFLVLDGPSRTGKTQFARSLVPDGGVVMELNCAGGAPVDLRGFQWQTHRLVLYDEIRPSQVLAQKKLFQCGSVGVQLGLSATGCYAYSVFVYKTRFVLCANDWSAHLKKLNHEDFDWIKENSFLVSVTSPLWIA